MSAAAKVPDLDVGEARWSDFIAAVRPQLTPATRFTERELLGPKTTMRVGGPARVYAEPAGTEDLRQLLVEAGRRQLPVLMLGRGSNLLVPDEGVDGLVINLGHDHWQKFEPLADGRIRVGAGLRLKNLCGLAIKAGLKGFEFLEGIPGNVGGALRMNAGAYGGETKDILIEAHGVDRAGNLRKFTNADMGYSYRHCSLPEDVIFTRAVFQGRTGDREAIAAEMAAIKDKREASQPRNRTGGSTFKNPPGNNAWKVIDAAGCRGLKVGGAQVSELHCNFLINLGDATATDIETLGETVRARVKAHSGVELEWEIRRIGISV